MRLDASLAVPRSALPVHAARKNTPVVGLSRQTICVAVKRSKCLRSVIDTVINRSSQLLGNARATWLAGRRVPRLAIALLPIT